MDEVMRSSRLTDVSVTNEHELHGAGVGRKKGALFNGPGRKAASTALQSMPSSTTSRPLRSVSQLMTH